MCATTKNTRLNCYLSTILCYLSSVTAYTGPDNVTGGYIWLWNMTGDYKEVNRVAWLEPIITYDHSLDRKPTTKKYEVLKSFQNFGFQDYSSN